jgi:anaphase-promoting complex subunit 2
MFSNKSVPNFTPQHLSNIVSHWTSVYNHFHPQILTLSSAHNHNTENNNDLGNPIAKSVLLHPKLSESIYKLQENNLSSALFSVLQAELLSAIETSTTKGLFAGLSYYEKRRKSCENEGEDNPELDQWILAALSLNFHWVYHQIQQILTIVGQLAQLKPTYNNSAKDAKQDVLLLIHAIFTTQIPDYWSQLISRYFTLQYMNFHAQNTEEITSFRGICAELREIGFLACDSSFLPDKIIAQIMFERIKLYLSTEFAQIFTVNCLPQLNNFVGTSINGYVSCLFGPGESSNAQNFAAQLQNFTNCEFLRLRTAELFNIIGDFGEKDPEINSLPALLNIKHVFSVTQQQNPLISALKTQISRRLLVSSASTADILAQFINFVGGLRVIDGSGGLLAAVLPPIIAYLRARSDITRCVVLILTGNMKDAVAGPQNLPNLYEELEKSVQNSGNQGKIGRMHQNWAIMDQHQANLSPEELDYEQDVAEIIENSSNWAPERAESFENSGNSPSSLYRSADLISFLIILAENQQKLLEEYINLLGNCLLQQNWANLDDFFTVLELFKLRFGEKNLIAAEIMLKDVQNSRRINNIIQSKLESEKKTNKTARKSRKSAEFAANSIDSALILSKEYWPALPEAEATLPASISSVFDAYSAQFHALKAPRTLQFNPNLGKIELQLELQDRTMEIIVTPVQLAILQLFSEKSQRNFSEIEEILGLDDEDLTKSLNFFQGKQILREISSKISENSAETGKCYELMEVLAPSELNSSLAEEFSGDSGGNYMENHKISAAEERSNLENYVLSALNSFAALSATRIHNMLKLFHVAEFSYNCSNEGELAQILGEMEEKGLLAQTNGLWQRAKQPTAQIV